MKERKLELAVGIVAYTMQWTGIIGTAILVSLGPQNKFLTDEYIVNKIKSVYKKTDSYLANNKTLKEIRMGWELAAQVNGGIIDPNWWEKNK